MRSILLCLILAACGKQASKETIPPLPTPTPPTVVKTTCEGLPSTSKYENNKSFDLNKTFVGIKYGESKKQSLCEVLKESKAKIVVMQFSGVFCISCQDQAKDFTDKLSKDAKHVVAFMDAAGDNNESDFTDFMNVYAPHSFKKFDSEKTLYRMLNTSGDMKFGMAIAFNGLGDIYFQANAEKGALDQFINELKKL